MKTTGKDITRHLLNISEGKGPVCEEKEYSYSEGFSRHGRSPVYLECPFCGTRSETTKWAFAGSGKRCENKSCGAMFGFAVAYKLISNRKGAE